MAENLNYGIPGTIRETVPDTIYTNNKKNKIKEINERVVEKTVNTNVCYGNDPANCKKYGSLYDWDMAMKACPVGFHLPSDAEWETLKDYVGDKNGTKLKSTSGWNNNGDGTDDYGFSALPGGYGSSDGYFGNAGYSGNWWSATEHGANSARGRNMSYNYEYVNGSHHSKTNLFSVRCAQD
jgi:uncharacterized protein (TIGR02145 family)